MDENSDENKKKLTYNLYKIFQYLNKKETKIDNVKDNDLKIQSILNFPFNVQQDCFEFYFFLLSKIEEDIELFENNYYLFGKNYLSLNLKKFIKAILSIIQLMEL
jgi:hypothetical protein